MLVRIQWNKREVIEGGASIPSLSIPPLDKLALGTAVLLTPSALLAFTMALWIIASDLEWTGEFLLPHGLFSHWQIWVSIAGVLLLLARLLNRYASVD